VEPMLCLPLPSANTSRYQPCSSANTSPCRAYKGLEPSSVCDMPGAPRKKSAIQLNCALVIRFCSITILL
ncbi:MAG: hypothetical protein AAGA77_22030, partial [Bacteroidota bacterium]